MKVLYIDSTLRKESRTKIIADKFIENLNPNYEIEYLRLDEENLQPLIKDFYWDREVLLSKNELDHPRFKYAHQLQNADLIVAACPFWDLSFPAIFKIYIENCSVDGITFKTSEKGLEGLCKANKLVYITTRGGFYEGEESLESAIPQLKNLCIFFGIDELNVIAADGMDIVGFDGEKALNDAITKAIDLAKTL